MAMHAALNLALVQRQNLSPQLQQALRLLQLSSTELELELREAVDANPLLDLQEMPTTPTYATVDTSAAAADDKRVETIDAAADSASVAPSDWSFADTPGRRGSGSDDDEALEAQRAQPASLRDELLWQVELAPFSPADRAIATAIVDALEDDGYLREPLATIVAIVAPQFQVDEAEVDQVRRRVQQFDPVGVASRDLADCLLAQLRAGEDDPVNRVACSIAREHLPRLPRASIDELALLLHETPDMIEAAIARIRSLDPKPGQSVGSEATADYVRPDVRVHKVNNRWVVELLADSQPSLAINAHYRALAAKAAGADGQYLRGQLQHASWLLRSLRIRGETLIKVATAIVGRQKDFLEFGAQGLHPLTLREIADEIGLHESTVSRATTKKYILTPRGTMELKRFFSSGVHTDDGGTASAVAIQSLIRSLVAEEAASAPYSDQALAQALNERGIRVARRTVAKYRELLRIPPSTERGRRVSGSLEPRAERRASTSTHSAML